MLRLPNPESVFTRLAPGETAKAENPVQSDGRRLRGDRKRTLILERAMEIASVRGLEGITLGELAEELHLSKSSLTVLFGDKQSLQIAIIDAAIDRFVEHVVEPARAFDSPLRRLEELSEGWYRSVEARIFPGGCFLHAVINEYRARRGVLHDYVTTHFNLWKRLLGHEIRRAVEAGETDPKTDVAALTFSLMAFQNTAHLAALLDDSETFERARDMTRAEIAALKRRTRRVRRKAR